VAIEQLQKEIAKSETELGKRKGEILALKKDLDSENGTYRYAGRTFTQQDVKRDLAARFARFKTGEETLASRQQILASRHRGLEAAREKLEGMLGSKRDLEVQIEHLDARVKTLQAAQTASAVVLDNSQLSRAKQLIADLNRQLDVTEKMLDAEGRFTGVIPVEADEAAPADLSREIDDYFGEPKVEQPAEKQVRADKPIDALLARD
jgi:peptidoglycan hydrolase CwlO-like protein